MPSRLAVVLVSLLVATPAVIFWLWLVILPTREAKQCPEDCWCDPGGYFVDCVGSGLNRIPFIFPTDVRKLSLDGIIITSLEKDIFTSRGLTELEELTAQQCQLAIVELGSFSGLTELRTLSLWDNEISEIIPGTFENLNRLEYLNLSHNVIEHLKFDVFSGLINLKQLQMYGNQLQYLHPDLFLGLHSLEQLILRDNPNLIVPFDSHFISSTSLTHLDLSNCNVSSVSAETFANLSALEWLHLSNNNLMNLDIDILKALPRLSTLDVYDNPLECDCQLQEVWRWCRDHNIETVHYETSPECDTPSAVHGMWWEVLEKGQCLQGDISYHGDYNNTSYSYTVTEDINSYLYLLYALELVPLPIYATLFTFGATGNVLLLITIICNKGMRTVPNMYILNLAISDIISLIVHFSLGYEYQNSTNSLQYGDFMCKLLPFCYRLSVGLSAYSVTVLSIQRYNVTVNPFHVHISSQTTWRVTVVTICGVWIVAALFALPSAFSQHFCLECIFNGCNIYYKMVLQFELIVSYVLPLCVIAFSYIMTARHLVKSTMAISEIKQHPQKNKRKNIAKILLGLSAVFVIIFVPYHIILMYSLFSNYISDLEFWNFITPFKLQFTYFISTCLLLFNSCLNPVVLCCTSRAFRRQFKRYLTCGFTMKSRISNFFLKTKTVAL